MRIGIEDIISDDADNVPLLETVNKNKVIEPQCIYDASILNVRDNRARNKLVVACVLCLVFMIGEVIGGLLSNSLAILTDSAHLFSDLSSFIVGLVAMLLANKPNSKTMTFGWHRAEMLGALFSVLVIWVVTGVLVYTAVLRIISNNFEINSQVMLIMSGIGVIINILMAFVLHPHSHNHSHDHSHGGPINSDHSVTDYVPVLTSPPPPDPININGSLGHTHTTRSRSQNINLRAAFIHVIGDIIQSFGVLIASFIIYFKPEWKIADPICTFIFSVLVLITTLSVFADIICVLLERKPRHLSYNTIYNRLITSIPGVSRCHHLRLWSITMTRTAASCHLTLSDKSQSQRVLDHAQKILAEEFHISEITIQIEESFS